jgi:hypothetical protein
MQPGVIAISGLDNPEFILMIFMSEILGWATAGKEDGFSIWTPKLGAPTKPPRQLYTINNCQLCTGGPPVEGVSRGEIFVLFFNFFFLTEFRGLVSTPHPKLGAPTSPLPRVPSSKQKSGN